MNLNSYQNFSQIDRENIIQHIIYLPNQISDAWQLSLQKELPNWRDINKIIVVGMGGSAIAADLTQAYISSTCKYPYIIHRDYSLPAWAHGPETLAIMSSHSGNTEEILSAYNQAKNNHCRLLSITTGGKLGEQAKKDGSLLWEYRYDSQPRSALGFSYFFILSILSRLNLIANPENEIQSTIQILKESQQSYLPQAQVTENPPKRLAEQLLGRFVTVIGYDVLSPVARRWKTQINELAKSWAQFEYLPEVNHNTMVGTENPQELLQKIITLFLRIPTNRSRNYLRMDLTKKYFMLQGINTELIDAVGSTPLTQQWSMIHFGDYLAYYLSIAYDVDPTPIALIENFKKELSTNVSM